MNNFKINFEEPYTTFDNNLLQKETVFKNSAQKLCYLYLYSYARAKAIFPSMPKIAAAICSTPRTAMTIIQQLEDMGFIEVERVAGKPNQYGLNNYFEVAKLMTSENISSVESPSSENISSVESTGENISPVKKFHYTSENISPVEPKPVKNFHPITSSLKTKSNNSSITTTSSSLVPFEILDVKLKNKYPNHPFEEIKAKMLEEAESGKCVITTAKQYSSLLEYRLKNYVEPKQAGTGQIRTKQPIRTEYIPADFDKPYEPAKKPTDEDELERKQMAVKLALQKFRGEITEEQYKKGMELLE